MNENNKKPILSLENILVALLVITTIVIVFLWTKSSSNDEIASLKKDISDLQDDIEFFETQKVNYTPDEVNSKIAKDKINIKERFDKKESDIKKGVTQVYEKTKTQKDYRNLEKLLTDYLGEQFSKKLIELSKPIVSESAKEQFPYEKLKDINIAFGEYDIVDHTVECFVLVTYRSSEIGANNPGVEREDKQVQIIGKDFFILNYNLEDDGLELVDHQRNLKSEVIPDE